MKPVAEVDSPEDALITDFAAREGYYTDTFTVDVAGPVTLAEFIESFYSTPLFKAERLVLRVLAKAPSTRADVAALAEGTSDRFAVWTVEERRGSEILLGAADERTKSWLRVTPTTGGTTLNFGSVVVPVRNKRGKLVKGPVFDALLKPHKVYSRMLLGSAALRFHRKYSPQAMVFGAQKRR